MPAAHLPRVVAALAAAVSGACGLYLLDARGQEVQFGDAARANVRGEASAVSRLTRDLDGPTLAGRAAGLRAEAALSRGDVPGAIAELRLAIRERPNDWRLRRSLAVALAFSGDRRGARRQAVRALELNPRTVLPSGFLVRVGGR